MCRLHFQAERLAISRKRYGSLILALTAAFTRGPPEDGGGSSDVRTLSRLRILQQQEGHRKDHPKDKLKEHAQETEQGIEGIGEQGRRRGGGGARIWGRRKTEGGGLRAEGLGGARKQ